MVRLGKSPAKFAIDFLKTEVTHLALVVVLNLSFRCQQATSLPLKVGGHQFAVLALRINLALLAFRRGVRSGTCH